MDHGTSIHLRTTIKPSDLGAIAHMHGKIYAAEYGFDETFEAYVAGPMAEFVCRRDPRERLWILEDLDRIVGCVAIVSAARGNHVSPPPQGMAHANEPVSSPPRAIEHLTDVPALSESSSSRSTPSAATDEAQLRWFLVDPAARGKGLGRKLLNEGITFAKSCGYRSIFLWTVDSLTTAAQLYTSAGFRLIEQYPAHQWGVDVVEQKFQMDL